MILPLVDSSRGRCHGNGVVKERLGKISSFSYEMAFFSLISAFLVQFQNQSSKLIPVPNFSQI